MAPSEFDPSVYAQRISTRSETSKFGEGDELDLFSYLDEHFESESEVESFTKLFLLLRPLGTRPPLPLLARPASALLREVVGAERGDLVPDAADRRELLPRGLPVLLGEGQSVEVLLFEARPLPRGVDLCTVRQSIIRMIRIIRIAHILGQCDCNSHIPASCA